MKTTPILLLASVLFVAACKNNNTNGLTNAKALKSVPVPSKNSIYLLDKPWQTQDGKTITLKNLRGKPRVLAMIFTRCQYACPHIVSDMKDLQNKLSPTAKQNTGFVLVSFDTEYDSSSTLKEYADKMNLDNNWILLHGGEEQTRELSALLNLNYEKQENGGFVHSNMISILDASGNLIFQQEGIDAGQTGLVNAIQQLQN